MKILTAFHIPFLGFLLAACSCGELDLGGDGDLSDIEIEDAVGLDTDLPDTSMDANEFIDTPGADTPTTGDGQWDPAIENMGDMGWRDSDEPACREDRSVFGIMDVWSDMRGVFITIPSTVDSMFCSILFNNGTGWSQIFEPDPSMDPPGAITYVTGIPGGPVFGWTSGFLTLFTLTIDTGSISTENIDVFDMFVVNETLAYIVSFQDPKLFMYDGVSWGPYPGEPLPYQVLRIWADENTIFVGGGSGAVLSNDGSGWTVHDTRTVNEITSLWGFSPEDVWAGTASGELLHYNGEGWEDVAWPDLSDASDACNQGGDPISGMWGTGSTLFFHTYKHLVKWDGAAFAVIGYWPGIEVHDGSFWYCDGTVIIRAIWGNSENELFLVVEENDHITALCEEYVLWWDGSEFHWF